MTEEKKSLPRRSFKALPDIQDKHPLPVEADVDLLWAAVMEKTLATRAYYEEWVGQFERTQEPARFLRQKRLALGRLLMKGLSSTAKEREKWLEKWKDLLSVWFTLLMRVAVYEPDPSFNRWFIEPALRTCGYRRIREALLEYLEHGTNREKAGAARAIYWAWAPIIYRAHPDTWRQDYQRITDECADVTRRLHIPLLKTFVECRDLKVRQSIIPLLLLKPSSYPEEWHRLIPEAIQLARTHPDEYIRHRVDIQSGGSGRPEDRDTPVEGASQE